MKQFAVYALIGAAVVVLVWPGSPAGRAVASVTDSLSGVLRGGFGGGQ